MATPGPMVLETLTPLRYVPLEEAGRARRMESMKASRFSESFSALEGDLADGGVNIPRPVYPGIRSYRP